MEISDVKKFFGVPVLVQLRFPLAGIVVKSKSRVPYASEPETSQWIPEPFQSADGSPEGTQLIACAVLQSPLGATPTTVEMFWSSIPGPPAAPGHIIGTVATLGTLLDAKDIVSITRVASVKEASTLILQS